LLTIKTDSGWYVTCHKKKAILSTDNDLAIRLFDGEDFNDLVVRSLDEWELKGMARMIDN